jgi:hypothetical protein
MAVNLSIKNVPDEVVDQLRKRAAFNRRSLQGELLAIVEAVAREHQRRVVTIDDLYEWAKAQNFPPMGDSAAQIREAREERSAHLERVLKEASAPAAPRPKRARRRR